MQSVDALLLRLPMGQNASLAAVKTLKIGGVKFDVEPMFTTDVPTLGVAAGGRQWVIARAKTSAAGINPWDMAHAALKGGVGLTGGVSPDVVEPDLKQNWLPDTSMPGPGLAAAATTCMFEDQNPEWPRRQGSFAWQLDDGFSQLRAARSSLGNNPATVRIAHLDTGYDPEHATFPAAQMELALQRSFVEGDNANDARDRGVDGALKSPGHGTGTLSLLAGARHRFAAQGYNFDDLLGGAPSARVVPVRVGNSVVQLTTSSVAKAINYIVELCAEDATRVDVISMSMGGVASAAWADAVNKAYDAGVVYVAAAGNNISSGFFAFPTHQIVYPARFRRVIAACGVMADRSPYYGLRVGRLQGNWGPEGAMATALSAFTPNVAWARWGCSGIVRMNGQGTSSATPQVAAAAALYFQRHAATLFDPAKYPEPWMRVEAVRQALFRTAADAGNRDKLGNGILQAALALAFAPAPFESLRKANADSAGFPFLNVLSRRGLVDSAEDRMLQLEATQLLQLWTNQNQANPLESAVTDPDRDAADVPLDEIDDFLEAVIEHPEASQALKERAKEVLVGTSRQPPPRPPRQPVPAPAVATRQLQTPFVPPQPPYRALRGYAVDPSLATALDTVGISEVTFKLPWETLQKGPVGEYLEVIDIDPASDLAYEPVDLDHPTLLAQDGLPPSEGVPQFHQQMTYAICSLTIKNFEQALGRKTLWRPGPPPPGANKKDDSHFVQRLRIYPHALREPNAFYSPQKIALLFGYFDARRDNAGSQLPGGRVFTCLSHDIVAHETTHALLDGMHRRFLLPSNRDVLAFHEGFADCVALLQHFTFPELVAHQISATRGSINAQENLLVQLARQFGHATGQRMALRDAIGTNDEAGRWQLRQADPKEYETIDEAHDRGRILVSAVFDAFLSIYSRRTSDLVRLASDGSGILRPGAIHPDLVGRLAEEASKAAQHVLTMCIRALDYCPPTDITFGEYLRAIITADYDLVADDDLHYRVSFIDAFRRWGIYPPGVRSLSLGSLLWRTPKDEDPGPSDTMLRYLKENQDLSVQHMFIESRQELFRQQRVVRARLHRWLSRHFRNSSDGGQDAAFLGLNPDAPFEVHTARIAFRTKPDGGIHPQLLLGLLQETEQPVNSADPSGPKMQFQGGSTIIADLRKNEVRYCIRKSLNNELRLAEQQQFALSEFDSLRATYLGSRLLEADSDRRGDKPLSAEPFALIHRGPT